MTTRINKQGYSGMFDAIFYARLVGALIGSSIAVVFRPGESWRHVLQKLIVGAIIGFIASPLLIDYLAVAHSLDYWLASATFCGLTGYFSLQLLFSEAATKLLIAVLGVSSGKK